MSYPARAEGLVNRIIPGHTGPESDGSKGVLHIPQSSSITGTSLPEFLVSYWRHSLGGLTLLQRCSRYILQSQPSGLYVFEKCIKYFLSFLWLIVGQTELCSLGQSTRLKEGKFLNSWGGIKVCYGCGKLLFGNSEVCIWLLFLLTSFTCYLFFVCRSCKGIKDWRKKTGIPLNSTFFFRVYDYFVVKCFPEPAEITTLSSQGVWRLSWNHFRQIVCLSVHHVSLCSVGTFSRGCS